MNASPPVELRLECMCWDEIRRAIDEGFDRAIIPCGAIEQHGPHLPLLVDSEHAEALAGQVAQRLGRTLVAPTIRVGCSEHHLAFAGTVSLAEATFQALLVDYVRSLARHGFHHILCFSAHGGNFAPLKRIRNVLDETAGPSCEVTVFADLDAYLNVWRDVVEREAGLRERVGGHADIAESSVMLALRPELVMLDAATPGFLGPVDERQRERLFRDGFDSVSPNGVVGDPRGMSRRLGERLIEEMVSLLTRSFEHGMNSESPR